MIDVKELEDAIATALVNSHPPGVKKYRNSLEQYRGHAKIAASVMLGRGIKGEVTDDLLETLEEIRDELIARGLSKPDPETRNEYTQLSVWRGVWHQVNVAIAKAKGEA